MRNFFGVDYTTFRRNRHSRVGGEFICVNNNVTCAKIWVDEVCEMIAVEVKDRDQKLRGKL